MQSMGLSSRMDLDPDPIQIRREAAARCANGAADEAADSEDCMELARPGGGGALAGRR